MSIDLNEVSERLLESGHIDAHQHLAGNEEWVIEGLLRVATGARVGREGKEAARVIAELVDWADPEGLCNLICATCDALGETLTSDRPTDRPLAFVSGQVALPRVDRASGQQLQIVGNFLVGTEDGLHVEQRTYNRHAMLLDYLTEKSS